MTTRDPKYTYYQPGEILFLLRHKKPQPIRASAESPGSNEMTGPQPAENEVRDQSSAQVSQSNPPKVEQTDDGNKVEVNRKIGRLLEWSADVAKKMDRRLLMYRCEDRELHFYGLSKLQSMSKIGPAIPKSGLNYRSPVVAAPGTFSIIPAIVKQARFRWQNKPDRLVKESKLAHLIRSLDENRKDLEAEGIYIEAVSPNWLASPTSEWGGGGGPGSRPLPYNGDPETAPHKFQLPEALTLKKLWPPNEAERGKGVVVAILDTAPSMHELVWAYEKYHKVNPEKQAKHHPLIESLLRPDGPFHLHPASAEDLFRMRAVHLRDHNYKMTDHGLFVAGIIHSIAPAAEIHLYEVLNSEGVGDLLTIYNTLAKILEEQISKLEKGVGIQPLVVNCSLTLNIPLNGDPDHPGIAALVQSNNSGKIVGHRLTDMEKPFLQMIKNDNASKQAANSGMEWVERTSLGIKDICDALFLSRSRVIAAAGNDWVATEDAGRPRARFPAAFKSVQGVGALPQQQNQYALAPNGQYEVASYSDLSDEPGHVGVVTLGGEAGEGKGVLGVYIGEFPPPEKLSFWEGVRKCLIELFGYKYSGPQNKSDWAWWAGTSFATPILTGAIAAVLSAPGSPPTTEHAIVNMYNGDVILENRTSYKEDLLEVTQG